jgi:hypothetical protein
VDGEHEARPRHVAVHAHGDCSTPAFLTLRSNDL